MSDETKREDVLPEPTDIEIDGALDDMKNADARFCLLYNDAPEGAKKRLYISAVVSKFRGKRNLWPLREERARIEHAMTEEDCEYLAEQHYVPTVRDHFYDLLNQKRVEKKLTPCVFNQLVAAAPAEERELIGRTVDRIEDLETSVIVTRKLVRDAICGAVYAQAMLGDSFLHGHEVERDVELAAFWCEKAAACGNETARQHLSDLRAEGFA